MLSQLTIQNFGLIDRVSIEFCDQLNILTGETGAGKSILIDALRLALGERLNSSQIRDPKLPCTIETVFELTQKDMREHEVFKDYLSEDEPTLIITRSYLPDGRSKNKVNGFSVTVAQLKEIGNHLIDFHGPHDHQMLLSSDSHLSMLDKLVNFADLKMQYTEVYREYTQIKRKVCGLKDLAESRDRDMDLLNHQIKELEQIPLESSCYEDLLQQQIKINNTEKLYESVNQLIQLFENDPSGITENIRQAFGPLKALNDIDEKTSQWMDNLDQLQENSQQLLLDLKDYAESLCFEPSEAQEINKQCDIYENIKRKYGPTLEDAQNFYAKSKERYELLGNLDHNNSELQKQIHNAEKELKQIANKITKKRKEASLLLQNTIEKELTELGIIHVKFECRFQTQDLGPHGQDKVCFYISPNAGEDLKPLAEIVSSGESARVMLALKKALIKVDPIPVLVFDEIDAQIGGRLGTITGRKLREISRNRQVILITHLPQIASFADAHFKVEKIIKAGRSLTTISRLDAQTRVKEIAKMMSGDKTSHISVTHAEDMLVKASKK